MKILFLGYADSPLISWLRARGHQMRVETERLTPAELGGEDWLISYGYRYLLKPDLLSCFPERALNLHISLLPWNRGAHPVLWSAFEGTPAGVSLHLLDAGLDTGPLVAQRKIEVSGSETLESAWQQHCRAVEELFRDTWPSLESGSFQKVRQSAGGTEHRARELDSIFSKLSAGWQTKIAEVRALGQKLRA